jgi:hypothetical protein
MNTQVTCSVTGPTASEEIRALFLCGASRAYGEINVVLPLAESVAKAGGEAWFLASPLAAQLARTKSPDRVFEMTGDRTANQSMFSRMIKKFRPNVILFSELYEILQPGEIRECPLLDWKVLRDLQDVDATLVFIDFIAHVQMLRDVLECSSCAQQLGERALQSFLERLWVIVPCPLNEPGPIASRRGLAFRIDGSLPLTLSKEEKVRCRSKYLGKKREKDGILIVRGNSTWQADLADQRDLHLGEFFTDLLSLYLEDLPKPVTLASVSDRHQLRPPSNNRQLKVVNLPNLPPNEYQTLLLSADLVLTDNEISYSVGRAVGNTPTMVLVNSFTVKDLFRREGTDGPLGRLISDVETKWPGSIFPHAIYPLPLQKEALLGWREKEAGQAGATNGELHVSSTRLGRMASSPFLRAELYGGRETKEMFHRVLLDTTARQELQRHELSYLNRLNQVGDPVAVLRQVQANRELAQHTVV